MPQYVRYIACILNIIEAKVRAYSYEAVPVIYVAGVRPKATKWHTRHVDGRYCFKTVSPDFSFENV